MPSADKRARKKENARAAREQRQAAVRRRKRLRSATTVGVVIAIFVAVIVLLSITGAKSKKTATTKPKVTGTTLVPKLPAGCVSTVPPKSNKPTYRSLPPMTLDVTKTYVAHFTTTCGAIDIALDSKEAPKTANSFVFLTRNHFYDGLKFHRVAKDFVVQGGDPKGDGTGGPGYKLPTEPPAKGYGEGSVAMANGGNDNTGSQFFFVLNASAAKTLGTKPPYPYSTLGVVTKGADVVAKLGSMYNPAQDPNKIDTQTPTLPLYIFTVTISES